MDTTPQTTPAEETLKTEANLPLPQTTPQKKLNWKAFFIGIVIVILIEIFAVNALKNDNKKSSSTIPPISAPTLANQTSDTTVNWQAFTDKNLSISFKYPQNWKVSESNANQITLQPIKDYNPLSFQQTGQPTSIQVDVTDTGNAVNDLKNLVIDPRNSQSLVENITSKEIPNAQYKTTMYLIKVKDTNPHMPGTGTTIHLTIVDNGSMKASFEDYSGSNTLLSQILSTFKFTDPTSNWKTYEDQNLHISFKYPPDWKTSSVGSDVNLVFSSNNKEYSFRVATGGNDGPTAGEIENSIARIGGKAFTKKAWINDGKIILISLIPLGNVSFNHIEMKIPQEANGKYLQIFNQILTTIKFTN